MATFAKKSFDAAAYAASRPTYPPQLFTHVLSTVPTLSSSRSPRTLLDLGAGPGLSTFDFSPFLDHPNARFDRVIGVDPSPNMVQTARKILEEKRARGELGKAKEWRFEVGRSDKLDGVVEDASVDLAIAGQAAHWFDPVGTYRELARVLKPGGAFAFWGYGEFFFPNRPELSTLIPPYSAGTLGPFWEQPGRSIVEALLTPFPFPSPLSSSPPSSSDTSSSTPSGGTSQPPPPDPSQDPISSTVSPAVSAAVSPSSSSYDPSSFQRLFFLRPGGTPPFSSPPPPSSSSSPTIPQIETHHDLLLTKQWNLAQLEAYLRTWSAAHSFNEAHLSPSTSVHTAGSNGSNGGAGHGEEGFEQGRLEEKKDCVSAFVGQLKRAGLKEDEEVLVAWELGIMSGRKRE
ncbi:hypothetical protein JCM8547_003644 [Rhodosporidiobolus lusitaniae]